MRRWFTITILRIEEVGFRGHTHLCLEFRNVILRAFRFRVSLFVESKPEWIGSFIIHVEYIDELMGSWNNTGV